MEKLEDLKKQAGYLAASLVADGDLVGLGTGSTVFYTIQKLAQLQQEGLKIQAVSTSFSTSLLCRKLNIPLLDLGSVHSLDIAIDGADEVDGQRNLIKGRGAAHVLEKIVAAMSKQFIVVADESKQVAQLGEKFAVPVEALPSALGLVKHSLTKLGALEVAVRMGAPGKDGPIISDSGNFILDAQFKAFNPQQLDEAINGIPGVLGHGIFTNLCHKVIFATSKGILEL
jgi:ribose 5-phosphate isomerase A